MLILGITGGIGSGKSTICRFFSVLGIPVYEADARAAWLSDHDPAIQNGITQKFGPEFYTQNKLNRKLLAAVVFENQEKLKQLNEIIHPVVFQDFENWKAQNHSAPYIIKEAAILFESGGDKQCDYTLTVTAPKEIRIQRVLNRDSVTREDILKRMENQLPEEVKISQSDFVIHNDNTTLLIPQLLKIDETIRRRANSRTGQTESV